MKNKFTLLLVCILLVVLVFSSCSNSNALTYKGYSISEAEYSYWFSTIKTQMLYSYNNGIDSESFWNTKDEDGKLYSELLTESINNQIACVLVSEYLFDEYKLSLSETDIKTIDNDIAEKEEYLGSREALNEDLGKFGINKDVLRNIYINNAKVKAVKEYLYGTNGIKKPTSEDTQDYFEQNYRAVKMIIIYTGIEIIKDDNGRYSYDEDGTVRSVQLTEDQKQIKKSIVDNLIIALKNGQDIDSIITQFSEIDYSEYPNGFFISKSDTNTYGADVVNAVWNLDIGECTSVSDDSMTFILYRTDIPQYSTLTVDELSLISNLETNMINKMLNEEYLKYTKNVKINHDITSKFDIVTASKNTYY